jgi:hypothetical protein
LNRACERGALRSQLEMARERIKEKASVTKNGPRYGSEARCVWKNFHLG